MFKHILVPIDGSDLSLKAAQHAVTFAKEVNAIITIFYVKPEYPVFYFGDGAAFDPSVLEDFAAMADQRATQYTEDVAKLCKNDGVTCHTRSVTNNLIHQAIVDTAQEIGADLIFMASHGRSGFSALLLGSETQKVLAHAQIPVLVYR